MDKTSLTIDSCLLAEISFYNFFLFYQGIQFFFWIVMYIQTIQIIFLFEKS